MSIPIEIEGVIIGFFLGLVAFVGEDFIRRREDKGNVRKKVLKHLLAEAKENRAILGFAILVSLEKDAWNEAKSSGVAMDLEEELRAKLIALYSRITEKNEILIYHRIGIQKGSTIGIQDATGEIKSTLDEAIVKLTVDLAKQLDEIIPMLEKA
jgi:hypothetical protein